MGGGIVTTGVDSLLELLRGIERISMTDASSQLGVPLETLQSWVDFLVEEKIVGIEYKFTKPFIFLNREQQKKRVSHEPELKEVKKAYEERARAKKIPAEQIPQLWESHVHQELAYLEQYFFEQAQKRGVQDTQERKRLWEAYQHDLLGRVQKL